jgi:peptidyl-prolyl cis-trans isomerase D
MFDLFRSRDKIVRIMLGGLLLVVALSMLTYLVPSYNLGGGGSDQVVAEIGKEAITLPEVQQTVQVQMRGRQMPRN